MVLANRWRASIHGRYTTGPWDGEIAQFGIGGSCDEGGGGFIPPWVDAPLPTFQVTAGGGSEVVAGLGTIDYGCVGTGDSGWTKDAQKTIAAALVAFATSVKSWVHSSFVYDEVRLSAFLPTNDVVNGATVVMLNPTVVGTDSTQELPPQIAIVSSQFTGGRGPRNRGRFYIPATSATQTLSGGLVNATVQGNVNTYTKTLWDAVEAIPKVYPAVVSSTRQTFSSVTMFKCGNHLDTQRRRAAGVRETYATLAN